MMQIVLTTAAPAVHLNPMSIMPDRFALRSALGYFGFYPYLRTNLGNIPPAV